LEPLNRSRAIQLGLIDEEYEEDEETEEE